MQRWQYWISQFGSKESKEFSRSLLLEAESLPRQPWELTKQRIRRTGFFGVKSDRTDRARQVGSFTVTNYFRSVSPNRETFIQAVPYASTSDAEMEVPLFHTNFHENRRRIVTVLDLNVVHLGADIERYPSWTAECLNDVNGHTTVQRILISSISRVLFVVSSTAIEEEFGLNWTDMANVARMQSTRIANASTYPTMG
jgi:hypothetical protein